MHLQHMKQIIYTYLFIYTYTRLSIEQMCTAVKLCLALKP